jgi:hypothetical protein
VPVASPELLHRIVHRAALRPRNEDDWWGSPIDTALATVALARHQRGFRPDALRAAARLERWWGNGNVAPISANVVALALTARAKAELQQTDAALTAAAAQAVGQLAKRDPSLAPELHLALCAWALDRLVTDRNESPWPELRERFSRGQGYGVDQPLRQFGMATASAPFDAAGLTQALLSEIGSSPSQADMVVLIWLITATLERVVEQLSENDSGLRVLVEQRANLVERLAGEVDEQTFVEPTVSSFDPDGDHDDRTLLYLSPMEALLLDLSLANRDAETPWLTFAEADELFGGQAHAAQTLVVATRERLLRFVAALAFLCAATIGTVVVFAAIEGGAARWVAVNVGLAVGAGLAFVAALLIARADDGPSLEAFGLFAGALAVIASIDAWNQSRTHPFLPDAAGVTVGVLVPAAVAVVVELARRGRSRDRR